VANLATGHLVKFGLLNQVARKAPGKILPIKSGMLCINGLQRLTGVRELTGIPCFRNTVGIIKGAWQCLSSPNYQVLVDVDVGHPTGTPFVPVLLGQRLNLGYRPSGRTSAFDVGEENLISQIGCAFQAA